MARSEVKKKEPIYPPSYAAMQDAMEIAKDLWPLELWSNNTALAWAQAIPYATEEDIIETLLSVGKSYTSPWGKGFAPPLVLIIRRFHQLQRNPSK